MRTRTVASIVALAFGFAVLFVATGDLPAAAQRDGPSELDLLSRYAPVLYFHPDEIYRPQTVDVLLSQARLRQVRPHWRDLTVLTRIDDVDLARRFGAGYYLDIWFGDRGSSDCRNYSSMRAHYLHWLSPDAGGPPVAAYGRVTRHDGGERIALQYWFFYFYNDWLNKHEGDWEMIQLTLDASGQPEWAVYSQHEGGTRRAWRDVPVEEDTHPVVFVALGSHANYFRGDEEYPYSQVVGTSKAEVRDRTGRTGRIVPHIIPFAVGPGTLPNDPDTPRLAWLAFPGGWGETAAVHSFSGPTGPRFKGSQWNAPGAWGMAQPLDLDTWYSDRLRVKVQGADVELAMAVNGHENAGSVETSIALALFHGDLQPGDSVRVDIRAPQCESYSLSLYQSDPSGPTHLRHLFDSMPCSSQANASLLMRVGELPRLLVAGREAPALPVTYEEEQLVARTLDFVWLPASASSLELVAGIGATVAAGLLPPLLLLGMVYYADRYEKEPVQLLLGEHFINRFGCVQDELGQRSSTSPRNRPPDPANRF